jgi:hypothetical protein
MVTNPPTISAIDIQSFIVQTYPSLSSITSVETETRVERFVDINGD